MNAQSFLEHFDRLSEAPDAISRLRSLVLDLAVTGKLVEQDSGESKCEFPQHVRTGIAELAASSQRCRWAPSAVISQNELASPLPRGWVPARLNDTGLYINGVAFKPSDWKAEGLPIIRIQNLSDVTKPFSYAQGNYPEENRVRKGDLLVSWSATLDVFLWKRKEGVLNQHIFKVLVNEDAVSREFLYWLLKREIRRLAASDHAHGLAMKHINRGPFLSHVVLLPPLAEQVRIVAKVDELMALCDELGAAQKEREVRRKHLTETCFEKLCGLGDEVKWQIHAQLCLRNLASLTTHRQQVEKLEQVVSRLAVTGKLSTLDRPDESATKLLESAGFTVAKEEGAAAQLPPSWAVVRLEDVASVAGGITLGRKFGGRKTVNVPYLRVANVKRGELDLSVVKHIEIPETEVGKYTLRMGDLLMTEGGDWDKVGRAVVWEDQLPLCLHQNHIFRARMKSPNIDPRWLELYFNSPSGRRYFEKAAKQTTNLASINMRQVRGAPVPLPPPTEQRRILERVYYLRGLLSQLRDQIEKRQMLNSHLLDAVLEGSLGSVLGRGRNRGGIADGKVG